MSVGKLNRPGLPFANVAASAIATANITPGRTIEVITLVMGGTFAASDMLDVKIKANGKPIVNATGAQLAKLAQFRGDTIGTHLPIYFSDFRGLDSVDQDLGGFDTGFGIESLTMEVTIGAGVLAPTLRYQLQESASQAGKGYSPLMTKVLRYPFNVSTGGDLLVALPFGAVNGAAIKRLHIEYGGAVGNVAKVTVKQDSNVIHEATIADVNEYNSRFGLVNQTKMYSIDFVANGGLKNAWDTKDARSIELTPNFLAADVGHVIVEYLDVLGNL